MRRARHAFIPSLFIVALLAYLPVIGSAQSRDRFVISARAGGVNAVTGRATMRAVGDSEWQQLTITEDIKSGDVVRTGTDGRVEMLLNPGSYLRIGENSEFQLADNSLENLEVRLIRGTAVVEATGTDNSELLINITTPHTKLAIVRRGLYRLNVVPGDATELIVRKGRVMLDHSHTKVKGGSKVVFSGGSFLIAKLENADKKNLDNLEVWSKERAETVARANRRIRGRDMSLLMASLNPDWERHFSRAFTGIWLFHPGFGCYTFVPLFMGWGSPYGSSYSRSFYGDYYNCCGRSGYGYAGTGYSSNGWPATSGSSTASPPAPSQAPAPSRYYPPASERKIMGPGSRPTE
jgi:FecR-like protein